MNRLDALNGLGLLAALLLSLAGGSLHSGRGSPQIERGPVLGADVAAERLADGTLVLRDASGVPVPLERYERIASGTLIADQVLSEICEPTRIVAFTEHGARSSRLAHRLAGKPTLGARASVESVLALQPDLLLVNNVVDPGYVARLREHGVRVFDLGHMRGLPTLLSNVSAIGLLIGAPERAQRYREELRARLARAAPPVAEEARPRAIYLGIYAGKLFGGAQGTSYHEVLTHAGLRDVAAEAGLEGWPELTSEQVMLLAPSVLVTKQGMGSLICSHPGLSSLGPCRGQGRVIELDGDLLDDPGPTMLEATEALVEAAWGPSPRNGLVAPRSSVQH